MEVSQGHMLALSLEGFLCAGLEEQMPGLPQVIRECQDFMRAKTYGPYRKGELTTFYMDGGAEIKIAHDGDRLNVRVINNGVSYVDGITILPHADNAVTLKPRSRKEAGLPEDPEDYPGKPH